MNFNEEQKKAAFSRSQRLCVSAGAGSGKTSVLVGRLIDEIVNRGRNIHEILAITFTNKAADEMKRRVAEELRRRGLRQALRELENAYISTIDSFASRLLRENPIEGGVDPKFSVIEEIDADMAMNQMVMDTAQEFSNQDENIRAFMLRYGYERVEASVIEIYKRVRLRGLSIEEAFQPFQVQIRERARDLDDALSAVLRGEEEKAAKKYEELFCAVRELRQQLAGMSNRSALTWNEIGQLRAQLKDKRIALPRAKGMEILYESILQFREESERFVATLIEENGLQDRDILRRLTGDFTKRYEAWKKERAVLDFSDLLHKTFALLANDKFGVGEECRSKFKLILMDEFQDTNPLQDRILECLLGANSVFLVGDEKQAIYGFRSADMELFKERQSAFLRSSPAEGAVHMRTNFRSTEKVISFVNDLFTEIWNEDKEKGFEFSPLQPDRLTQNTFPESDVPAVEWLVAGRIDGGDEAGDEGDDGDGDEIDMAAGRFSEARLLAARLKEMVEKDKIVVYDRSLSLKRAIRFSDVAVLFRTRTALPVFERAFRETGIPYLVVSGNSFYQQTEIRDVISFLSLLENPTFDIPLAAVLRSPFVNLEDDSLLWLSRFIKKYENRETALFSAVLAYDEIDRLNNVEKKKIESFLKLYNRLCVAKDQMRIADLLRLMLKESYYELRLLSERNGKRSWANLLKLLDLASQFEERESHSLSDFVHYLRDLEAHDVEEEEARTDSESDDVVKLITIHKAKGLEFPVVVAADLGSIFSERNKSFAMMGRDGRVALKVFNPITSGWEKPVSYLEIARENLGRRKDELKRLFYVALTRARERILLSGVVKNKTIDGDKAFRDLSCWTNWLRKAFGLCDEMHLTGLNEIRFGEHVVRVVSEMLKEVDQSSQKEFRLADAKAVRDSLCEGRSPDLSRIFTQSDPNEIQSALDEADRIIEQTKLIERPFFQTVDLSVTSFLTYEVCPRFFYYRHVLNLPEIFQTDVIPAKAGIQSLDPRFRRADRAVPEDQAADRRSVNRRGGDKDVISSVSLQFSRNDDLYKDIGTFVHSLLEHLEINTHFLDNLNRRLETLRMKSDSTVIGAADKILRAFAKSGAFEEISSSRRRLKEFPFYLRFKHGTIKGNIDLMYETENGLWIVADYKTSNVDSDQMAKQIESYEKQVLIYALAAKELMRKAPQEAKLFFLNKSKVKERCILIDERVLQDVKNKIEATLQQITAMAFFPKGDRLCAYCVTEQFCRRHAELNLSFPRKRESSLIDPRFRGGDLFI